MATTTPLTRTEIVNRALDDRFEAVRPFGVSMDDHINKEMDEGTFDSASLKTCMKNALQIQENLLADLVHEAANILSASDNGGWAGRPSEVKRALRTLIEQIEGQP